MLNLLEREKEKENNKRKREKRKELSHLRHYLIPTLHVTHNPREMRSERLKTLKEATPQHGVGYAQPQH